MNLRREAGRHVPPALHRISWRKRRFTPHSTATSSPGVGSSGRSGHRQASDMGGHGDALKDYTPSTWMRSIFGVRAGTAALATPCEVLEPFAIRRSPPRRLSTPAKVVDLGRTDQPRAFGGLQGTTLKSPPQIEVDPSMGSVAQPKVGRALGESTLGNVAGDDQVGRPTASASSPIAINTSMSGPQVPW